MAIKRVFSAGGIVVRDFDGKKKVLVSQSSAHKGWDFPKGHIEEGESAEQAAVREVEEETGVKAEIIQKAGASEYFYYDSGEKILKTVVYFVMKYIGEGEATTAFEVEEIVWLEPNLVEEKLSFKETKRLYGEVKGKISDLKF